MSRPVQRFACGRSCARWQACRFAPVLGASHHVHSHTVRVAIAVKDRDAFEAAAREMGANILGDGTWPLYESTETGFAVHLPRWAFPIVATTAGHIAADPGDDDCLAVPGQLQEFTGRYVIAAARRAADVQGWYSEMNAAGELVIYHPDGGTLTVTAAGVIDAAGFTGCGCDQAAGPIAEALGRQVERTNKPEYLAERAHVRAVE